VLKTDEQLRSITQGTNHHLDEQLATTDELRKKKSKASSTGRAELHDRKQEINLTNQKTEAQDRNELLHLRERTNGQIGLGTRR